MSHKSIQKHFNEWITQVYGGQGLTKEQREELRKAFYSGTFIMANVMRELGELEDKAVATRRIEVYHEEMIAEIAKWIAEGRKS